MDHLSEVERKAEQSLINLASEVKNRGFLTTCELWQVSYWNTERKSKLTLENSDTKTRTEKAFLERDDWCKLNILRKLKGIGEARASAILHLYDTEPYPIIDRHALWSVGEERKYVCSKKLWREYVKFCRDHAEQHTGGCMRKLDRALWRYSYEMEQQEKEMEKKEKKRR